MLDSLCPIRTREEEVVRNVGDFIHIPTPKKRYSLRFFCKTVEGNFMRMKTELLAALIEDAQEGIKTVRV